jgi:hypothetical protein
MKGKILSLCDELLLLFGIDDSIMDARYAAGRSHQQGYQGKEGWIQCMYFFVSAFVIERYLSEAASHITPKLGTYALTLRLRRS